MNSRWIETANSVQTSACDNRRHMLHSCSNLFMLYIHTRCRPNAVFFRIILAQHTSISSCTW